MENPQEPSLRQPEPEDVNPQNTRRALNRYLRKLRRACAKITTVDDWTTLVTELNGILEVYKVEIPVANRERLGRAMQISDTSKEALTHACSVLDLELTNTINALPKRGFNCGCVAAAILGGLIALVVALLLAAVFFLQPVQVAVVNEGCSPLIVREGVPTAFDPVLRFFQVQLPEVIDTNEVEFFEVSGLPLNVDINGLDRQAVVINVIGVRQSISVSSDVTEIIVNGFPILGTTSSVNVRGDAPHEVNIICQ